MNIIETRKEAQSTPPINLLLALSITGIIQGRTHPHYGDLPSKIPLNYCWFFLLSLYQGKCYLSSSIFSLNSLKYKRRLVLGIWGPFNQFGVGRAFGVWSGCGRGDKQGWQGQEWGVGLRTRLSSEPPGRWQFCTEQTGNG